MSRPVSKEEKGPERRRECSTAEWDAGVGLTNCSAWPVFADFEALAHRQNSLCKGLTSVHEKAALLSFVGTGITDANRYVDAAAAFSQFHLTAPAHDGVLIQVFTLKLREESQGGDFLYLHFTGDPIAVGFLICALTGGGLMAGWQVS
jgi:hypothetical protein